MRSEPRGIQRSGQYVRGEMEEEKSNGSQTEYLCFAVTRRRLEDLVGLGLPRPPRLAKLVSSGRNRWISLFVNAKPDCHHVTPWFMHAAFKECNGSRQRSPIKHTTME